MILDIIENAQALYSFGVILEKSALHLPQPEAQEPFLGAIDL